MKRSILISSLIALFGAEQPAWAGSVRGGGDTLRLTFVQARETAAHFVAKINEAAIPSNLDPEIRKFIISNKNKLAGDLLASDHEWIYEENTNFTACAQTDIPLSDEQVLPRSAKVSLYFPVCRTAAPSVKEAAALLIHESVHHFGIQDHEFCDQVALAIIKAWEKGLLDWEAMPQGPEAREGHTAVWTGQEMLIYGGSKVNGDEGTNDFYAYNPEKRAWRRIEAPANLKRTRHLALWTDDEMIIWGGEVCVPIPNTSLCNVNWLNSGAAYNLETNTWRLIQGPGNVERISLSNSSYARKAQDIAWTGNRLAVWGGDCALTKSNLGGLIDIAVANAKWESITPDTNAQRCSGHTLTYGDGKLYVYGGFIPTSTDARNPDLYVTAAGSVYDLKAKSWSILNSPSGTKPRYNHTAVWSGKDLIVFSGVLQNADTRNVKSNGLLYRPGSGWKAFASESVQEREGHVAIWTGNEMLVYGGKTRYLQILLGDVSFFDPATMTWRITGSSSENALDARMSTAAAWTGDRLLVWGGLVSATGAAGTATRAKDGAVFRP